MDFDELTAEAMHSAIINGCHRLIEQREELNQINVFPVADGDTGDNMASVCSAIIDYSAINQNVKLTIKSIRDASILGSRGNSGILLSQFFLGLNQHIPSADSINIHQFCDALRKTGEEINSVLSTPVEGTIITIVKKLAAYSNAQKHLNSITKVMTAILPSLKEEVEKTPEHLKILQESKVVDAGALGFYYFIEGFTDFFVKGVSIKPASAHKIHPSHTHQLMTAPQFRYCTEAVLKESQIDPQSLLKQLHNIGDSMVAIGTKDLLKIHLHTNEPIHLFNTLYQLGTVKYPKVDDMQRQYEIQFVKKHSIALVTDSSADLPQDLFDKYQIHVFPLNIHIGEHDFLDKYSFEPNHFYDQLQHLPIYPKTSCISPHQIKQHLHRLRAHYDHVLILSISSAMSGMHAAFVEASKDDEQIRVLDTKNNSAAHGLLLDYAGQLIADKLSFREVVDKIQTAITDTFIFVLVNQFDAMVRSGRMGKLSGKVASWSGIKPIVSIDKQGRGMVAGKTFSSTKGLQKLLKLLKEQIEQSNANLEDYAIVHANNAESASLLARMSSEYFNKPPLFIQSVSLVIGLHAGKGCVAIAARVTPKQ